MRVTAFLATAAFVLAAGSAMACPMESVAKGQTVASSSANSTPIPAKAQRGNNS
jgi:hypothetical protein